jgi:adenylate cyclase class 2
MSGAAPSYPMEIEGKYRVDDEAGLLARLAAVGARPGPPESHEDHYLQHPARDFRATDEALRMRRVNDEWFVTYKGPRAAGPLKSRPEIELPIAAGSDGAWLQIWAHLGFRPVAVVRKTRRVFSLAALHPGLHATLDHVPGIGHFAEIECVVHGPAEREAAEAAVHDAAARLGLHLPERRSYLAMVLQQAE